MSKKSLPILYCNLLNSKSFDPLYIVTYNIEWVKTFWHIEIMTEAKNLQLET